MGLQANKAKAAELDRAAADGDLLSAYDTIAMTLRPDLSLGTGSMNGMRYLEITSYVVKPGHMHEFVELSKMYAEANRKAAPGTHWACYEVIYGDPVPGYPSGGAFVVMNGLRTLAEVDAQRTDAQQVAAELGTSGMAKAESLTAASIETQTVNLFRINPRMSNPFPQWVEEDTAFWSQPPTPPKKRGVN